MLHWYVGPWLWQTGALPFWRAPSGLAGLDLRTLPAMAQKGGSPGPGLFVGGVAPASLENRNDYTYLGAGSWYDLKPTTRQKDAIPRRAGYTLKGDDLVGLILDLMTDGADPAGLDGPRPIVPTSAGRVELHLGQHHHERFRFGRGHSGLVRDVLRADFAALWQRDQTHARKVLDFWCEKYRVEDWREFVPLALQGDVPGRLPHDTTITESFNTADSDTLGPDLSWTELSGDLDVVSNQARTTVLDTVCAARADSDLSSDDHYAQAAISAGEEQAYCGVCCRFTSSAELTFYLAQATIHEDTIIAYKSVAGTETQIGSTGAETIEVAGGTLKIESDGSTIKAYWNGVEEVSTTDSAVTGNTRGGLKAYKNAAGGSYCALDSFQAADLAVAGIVYTQLERGTRGLLRGAWTGRQP